MKMTRLQSCPPHPMVRLPHADHGGHPLVPHEAIVQSFQKIIASSSHLNPHRAKKSGGDLDLCGRKVVEYLDGDPEDWSMIWTANTTASIRILMDHYEFGGAPLIGIDIRSHTSAAVPSKQIAQKGCGQVFYFSTLGSIPVGGLLGDEVQRVDHQGGPIVNSLLDYLPGGHFTDALSWPRHPLLMIPSVSNYDGCHCDVSAIQRFVSAWKCEGVDWRVCIDAAKSFGDGSLRLSNLMEVADYVVFSMFKLCGLSNGVGCLLVRRAPLSLFPLIQDSSGPHHYPCYGGGGVVQWSPTTDHVIPTPELPLRMSTGTPPYLSILHNIDMMETWGKWNAGGRMNRNANTLAKLLISNLPLGLILLNGHPSYYRSFQGSTVLLGIHHPRHHRFAYRSEFPESRIEGGELWRTGPCCNYGGYYTVVNGISVLSTQLSEGCDRTDKSCESANSSLPVTLRVSFGGLNDRRDVRAVIRELTSLTKLLKIEPHRVADLVTYPLKGCSTGIHLRSVHVSPSAGLPHDRLYHLKGSLITPDEFEISPSAVTLSKKPLWQGFALRPSLSLYGVPWLILPLEASDRDVYISSDLSSDGLTPLLATSVSDDGEVQLSSYHIHNILKWSTDLSNDGPIIFHRHRTSPMKDVSFVEATQVELIDQFCGGEGKIPWQQFRANVLLVGEQEQEQENHSNITRPIVLSNGGEMMSRRFIARGCEWISRCQKINRTEHTSLTDLNLYWKLLSLAKNLGGEGVFVGVKSRNAEGVLEVGDIVHILPDC
eukprot:GHVH01006602.1.p1 GENE.GHVH01006602.1~~GHVH01006602.1.p1  ORF type:complete len:767 (+),score=98.17 GHVH01006602.1:38-2338(+)